jgi:hypothetical protein
MFLPAPQAALMPTIEPKITTFFIANLFLTQSKNFQPFAELCCPHITLTEIVYAN